jgi:hypothetical protein
MSEISTVVVSRAELLERIEELESFKREWEPVLITLMQSFVAFLESPMGKMMPLPPQVQVLLTQIKGN